MSLKYKFYFYLIFQIYFIKAGSIQGNIIDAVNQLPLVGANISVIANNVGAVSDDDGNFSITGLENGYYSISVSYMGYESKSIADIWVRDKAYEFLNIQLKPTIINYSGVMVTKGYFSKTSLDQYSSVNFNNDEIRRAPGAGQEISRILNALPSVASVGENRQDMLVRGGGPTENGFIIDNIYIPSISHFNTPDGRSNGPIGLINTEMVDDIEFFSNGFPAEYGNKLSSYGNIRYRNGKKDSLAANISIGMGGAGGLVEGSLTDDVTFIGSYRRSYLDIISEAINAGGGLPRYGDLQGKLKYNPSHFSAYTILFINGNSLYERGKNESKSAGENTYGSFKNNQNTLGLAHRYIWNKNTYSNTSFSLSYQDAKATFYENKSDTISLRTNDLYKTFNARQLNHIRFNELIGGLLGIEIQNRNLGYDFLLNNVESKNDVSVTNLSSFLTFQSALFNKALISLGFRFNWNSHEENILIAPRINIDFSLDRGWGNVIYNSGTYFQNPPEKYLSIVDNNDLKTINTFQHSLTFEKLITNSTKFSISIYKKNYYHAPMMENNEAFTDPTFLLDELRTYSNIISSGKAETNGIEILLEKKRAINFYGLVGGSVYNSMYNDQNGIKRNRNNNYEYLFNLVGGYRPNPKWEISLRWSLFGGKPYTKVDLESSNYNNEEVLDYSEFNDYRTPVYHNLFLRYERRKSMKFGNIITYFEFWNAYNRKNIETYFWSRDKQEILETSYFSFIPVGGIEIEF